MKILYPEIKPYQTVFLETGSKHSVYVEQSGNPEGIPVVFLHGGPCSGTKPDQRRFFNPERYRIILFDQRGCGLSQPFGELQNNTTQDLIDDMERIRERLKIGQWVLFGGSWGAALALLYAQKHTEAVAGMVLRGVFLARKKDLDWFVKEGANRIYPEQWQRLLSAIPLNDRNDLIYGLDCAIGGNDEVARMRAAKEWTVWGGLVSLGNDYETTPEDEHSTKKMVLQVGMEMHYAKNRYFIEENQILEHCHLLRSIPAVIIHGRYDLVCPAESGYLLHQALPHAEFRILPCAGHVAKGEQMIDALVSATDKMAQKLKSHFPGSA
ncbi:MAG: prolyl aminopeptidase [Gammaproteobacteria bacterium]